MNIRPSRILYLFYNIFNIMSVLRVHFEIIHILYNFKLRARPEDLIGYKYRVGDVLKFERAVDIT